MEIRFSLLPTRPNNLLYQDSAGVVGPSLPGTFKDRAKIQSSDPEATLTFRKAQLDLNTQTALKAHRD